MGEVSNDTLYELLCQVKNDVGEIKGAVTATAATLAQHVQDDKKMASDIYTLQISPIAGKVRELELEQAKSNGSRRTWGIIATAVSSLAGAAVGFFVHR